MLIIFLQSERALSIRKNQGFLFPLKILAGRKFFFLRNHGFANDGDLQHFSGNQIDRQTRKTIEKAE